MDLPELPSEKRILEWFRGLRRQLTYYASTLWYALRSPTSVVELWMNGRSTIQAAELTRPLPFALLTLVVASLLGTLADLSVGVDQPFFQYYSYYARLQTYGHWLDTVGKGLPGYISPAMVLVSVKFALVMLPVIFWARMVAGRTRRYWTDAAAFLYLLPLVLIIDIIDYCATNLTFRIIGDRALLFMCATFVIGILSAFATYGIVLRIVDRVYNPRAWRRILHIAVYLAIVPVLLQILNAVFYWGPVGLYALAVIKPTMEGDAKLNSGDYEAAEKLNTRAIENDRAGVWSMHARIRLVSTNARRILALLPSVLGDAGIRQRLLHNLEQADPLRQVANAFRLEGSADITPARLTKLREAILRSSLTVGDIPVTSSELDCALGPTAVDDGCDELPKDALTAVGSSSPAQRQQLCYQIYRARALRGEPAMKNARRYLLFLLEVSVRIEVIFVRYHALNLARDSETLAYLDDQDRTGRLDRENIIKGNRDIRDHGYKFPHLLMPDAELDKLSDKELGFDFRQVLLNYLRSEARELATSRLVAESSVIRQQVASIEERLNWVANDAMYTRISR